MPLWCHISIMEVGSISLECGAVPSFPVGGINYLPIPSCQQSSSSSAHGSAFSSPTFSSLAPLLIGCEVISIHFITVQISYSKNDLKLQERFKINE
ncbi:unnamed protein product [Acanthocheilonema viteae]|uniref:Uncharacterized protein n=1 Tax=Acanthocheilonema viteae TaxID=6277 RepID=A0A498SEV9_ACAVI|nr:unnamed protein product [Acanthocheilonema viteae]VBB30213.1 unnamed protein product [Acanthocheilonema viteae]VBB30463.1 unnamed protein product [Acanthocheilonema viteae]VBB31296.1 unnamed protein product [Acanthocheilonema viteae]